MQYCENYFFDDSLKCDQVLNAFIVYDGRSAGQRAMQLVGELERQTQNDIRPLLWRFDVLADPGSKQLAASDALRADLLIVSAASRELPVPVKNWLTVSLSGETFIRRPALVVLVGKQGQTAEANLSSLIFLQGVAKKWGLTLFAPRSEPPADLQHHRNSIPRHEVPVDSGEEMHQLNHGYRHWGLNE